MSYLQLDKGLLDFSKAVISFWFRLPAASITAATQQFYAVEDSGAFDFNLQGIIPLVTFGPNETMVFYATFDGGDSFVEVGRSLMGPCFIGVRCGPVRPGGAGPIPDVSVLQAKIQYSSGGPPPPHTNQDLQNVGPDFFQVGGYLEGSVIPGVSEFNFKTIDVTPDRWHHVLVSFDMTDGAATAPAPFPSSFISFDSVCKFWWSYDDVNYDGEYLWPTCPVCYGPSDDKNGIVSSYCLGIGILAPHSFPAGLIPTDGKPVGVPTSGDNVAHVYPVEMAELQVFTDVTLDTSITANRRAFITASGSPADPLKKPNPPPPVPLPPGWVPPLKGPQELLGKEADILLHGSGNWINGTNTGKAIKLNEIGKPTSVPAENFEPTGVIVSYSPDPSLHGPQSSPPKPPSLHATLR